jgi:hypothetical protein
VALILRYPSIVTFRSDLVRIVVPLLMMGFAPACGGKIILGETVGSGEDSGTIGATDGSGASCNDFEILPSDVTCGSDSECSFVRTGEVCSGQCLCGDPPTPVNAAAQARFQSETASLNLEACACTFLVRCLGGQCTLCGGVPNQPSCNEDEDGGITTPSDSGIVIVEGGEFDTGADGGACVYIDLSTYDRSCTQASDCILIDTGEICTGQCACGGEPVSASEQSRYDETINSIVLGACSCSLEPVPSCFENKCQLVTVLPVDP